MKNYDNLSGENILASNLHWFELALSKQRVVIVMNSYYNVSPLTGKPTGIRGYEYDDQSITVYFTSGSVYNYTYASAGAGNIETMKRLADGQESLNTFLTKNKPGYAWKR